MNYVSETDIETLVETLRTRIGRVEKRIFDAASRVERSPGEVQLVVVTKAHPIARVHAAIQAGAQVIGENYVAEAVSKSEQTPAELRQKARWDMIGHVQSRKAKDVALYFDGFQALDSVKLANRLERTLAEIDKPLPVLVQVNVSGEAAKFGLPAWLESQQDDLLAALDQIHSLDHLKVEGLMTIPPFLSDPEAIRPYFRRLRELRENLQTQRPHFDLAQLSMGMSGDYEVAVEEGATIVRVGTAIMGARPAKREA